MRNEQSNSPMKKLILLSMVIIPVSMVFLGFILAGDMMSTILDHLEVMELK